MVIGIIGVGVVGGTLKKWFENFTDHDLRLYDPAKNMNDSFEGVQAAFVCVPVPATETGQDQSILESSVNFAKQFTDKVFIRSSVLPNTADRLGCIAMPEFLTERTAYDDMCKLPILSGKCDKEFLRQLFPDKDVIVMRNNEAEMAKYAHNCFGAFKVTFWNMMFSVCEFYAMDFEKVKRGAFITKFIEKTHTLVPGPDGLFGWGGKCFPENMMAMRNFFRMNSMLREGKIFDNVIELNKYQRSESEYTEDALEGVAV